jgi:MerR family mercuric resistance operon transcriptional regulator
MSELTIGALARAAGVNVETIRFYQRKGLLAEPEKPLGGIRRYQEADVRRVQFIKSAQKLGFTLDEVANLLQLEDGLQCSMAKSIAEQKLAAVRERIQQLQQIESALARHVKACDSQSSAVCCPLIAALQGDAK